MARTSISAITTSILEHILFLGTIISQSTYSSSQLRIIGSYSTTITKSAKVLARVE